MVQADCPVINFTFAINILKLFFIFLLSLAKNLC
jgi:hypothetical protein